MIYRSATDTDSVDLDLLMVRFVEEMFQGGSELSPSIHNLKALMKYIWSWVDGASDKGSVVVAEEDGEIIGFVAAGSWGQAALQTRYDPVAYELGMYVKPDFRGFEVVRNLIDFSNRQLKDKGFNSVQSGVHYWNKQAISVLEKVGFVPLKNWLVKQL